MILADKIIQLRKKNGWSQEELGEQLGVSRQAVSKWESMQSVPDINKIIAMAQVFGVSTDYLLKDEMETPERAEHSQEQTEDISKRVVKMEEANEYLSAVKDASGGIGAGLFLFCVSPVLAAILYAVGADRGALVGTIIQILILTAAVIVFILSISRLMKFSYLKKGTFETEYGVDGMVRELMKKYEQTRLLRIIIGAAICFTSVIPLMICSLLTADNDLLIAVGGGIMLIMIGAGVYLLVQTCVMWKGFKKLL
ncbi:MAG: helix-turn-helix transcriptional regulator [Ruminococcaceae bacterium]|nr:helix-turn-helix transcriptional regulator [Oscillospiraceae bacterium]